MPSAKQMMPYAITYHARKASAKLEEQSEHYKVMIPFIPPINSVRHCTEQFEVLVNRLAIEKEGDEAWYARVDTSRNQTIVMEYFRRQVAIHVQKKLLHLYFG